MRLTLDDEQELSLKIRVRLFDLDFTFASLIYFAVANLYDRELDAMKSVRCLSRCLCEAAPFLRTEMLDDSSPIKTG